MPVSDDYWKDVSPSYLFLKESLSRFDREKLKNSIGMKIPRSSLDTLFLNEARHFLRLSIINLLAYKYIAKGNYFAWAKVTLYYSYFYIINCLLRLQKYAIVHVDYLDKPSLVFVIDRSKDNRYYNTRSCGRNQHDLIWKAFESYYPNLISKDIGKFYRDIRMQWNYDLFFASQTTTKYSVEEAKTRWENNFLDPNYGIYSDPNAAEYYYDLMADTGWEEVGVGDMIKHAIEKFSNIGLKDIFTMIKDDLDIIESSEDTKRVILTWIDTA